ncbi:hypothetical protein ACOI4F_12850 [Escherichia coli]
MVQSSNATTMLVTSFVAQDLVALALQLWSLCWVQMSGRR